MTDWIFLFLAILLNVGGHVFLKLGMNQIGKPEGDIWVYSFNVIKSGPILGGLACYVLSVAAYLYLLSKNHLSSTYPIVMSVAYMLIIILSFLWFKEPFTANKWIGVGLILVGVFLIARN